MSASGAPVSGRSGPPNNLMNHPHRPTTAVLAALRGALLDLLATGDLARTAAAVEYQIDALRGAAS